MKNTAIARAGVAKQTAKGTPAANPTFAYGLTDGAILTEQVDQVLEEHTSATRAATSVNRNSVIPGATQTSRVHPGLIGLLLYGALGGISTTGAGPYDHTITQAGSQPWLTVFGEQDGSYHYVADSKISKLTIAWTGNEPLTVEAEYIGCDHNIAAAAFTAGTDETADFYFTPVGGTFSVDVDDAGSATALATITSGEITITGNVEAVLASGNIQPTDISEGRLEVECTFEVVPDDWTQWRTLITGTPTGTVPTGDVIYGTFSCDFVQSGGTDELVLTGDRVAYMADFPNADPSGGATKLSLAGMSITDTATVTSPLTAVLTNDVATY